ncbi:MAG: tetratricopeptide repeat protein [Victivallaceae bacterium]|nr:tetratricopeptide repeat protein [Victivallaceae bacterium]
MLILSALLPLKFGSLAMPGAGAMPDGVWGWLLTTWPLWIFRIAAPAVLLLALAAYRPEKRSRGGDVFCLLFLAAAVFAFFGTINASQTFYSHEMLLHLGSLSCYLFAANEFLTSAPSARERLTGAIGIGAALALATALHQYFFGFDQMLEFIAGEREHGVKISAVLEAKLIDRRTSLPFDLSNSLAGFILAALPVLLIAAWRAGGRFEPQKLSRLLFTGLAAAGGLFVFATTRSRAAAAALILALVFAAVVKLKQRRLRIAAAAVAAAAIAGGMFYAAHSERGLGSFRSRIDYARVAVGSFAAHPLAGAGWGEFHYDYMLNKYDGTEEAPQDPHNLPLAFFSQAGMFAGLAICLWMLWPLIAVLRHGVPALAPTMLLTGWFAFCVHSMADVNLLTVSGLGTAGAAGLLLLHTGSTAAERWRFFRVAALLAPPVLAAGLLWSPESTAIRCGEAAVKQAQGDISDALRLLDRATRIAPRDPAPRLQKMELLHRLGDDNGARRELDAAREKFPDNWLLKGEVPDVIERLAKSRALK